MIGAAAAAALGGIVLPAHAQTAAGTIIHNAVPVTYEGSDGKPYTTQSNAADIPVAAAPAIQVLPSYDRTGLAGREMLLPHTVRNSGNVPLDLQFSVRGGAWSPALVLDTNANGVVDAGETAPGTVTVGIGQSVALIIRVTPPLLAANGAVDTFVIGATAVDGSVSGTVADIVRAQSNSPAKITVTADPSTILGDGQERSKLTATVLTARDTPVPDGTPVEFVTPRGHFESGLQAIATTTLNGIAIAYLTGDIVANTSVTVVAHVTAGTPLTGTASADVNLIFTPASITGRVIEQGTQRPQPGLTVQVLDADGNLVGETRTGADGSYEVHISRMGTYTLRIPVTNSAGDTVIITETIVVDRLGGVSFSPQGAIVGVVMDVNTHEPLGNIALNIYLNLVTPRSAAPSRAAGRETQLFQRTTDAHGGFVINNLPLGLYDITVTAADGRHYSHGLVSVGLSKPGEYVVNADILLDPLGFVYDRQTGARIPGATVSVSHAATGQAVVMASDANPQTTEQDGTYHFVTGTGAYTVRVSAPGYVPYQASFTAGREVVNPQIPLDRLPQLTLSKQVDHAQVSRFVAEPGEELVYTLTAANVGQGSATGTVLTDTLPEWLTLVPGSLGVDASYDPSTRRITWQLGTLVPQGATTVSFRAHLPAVMPEGNTDVTNSAQVACSEAATPVGAQVTTRVTSVPRLDVTKTADRAAAAPGDTVRFTITVRNSGAAPARDVTVTDALPDGLVLPDGTRTATWHLDELAVGGSQSFTLETRVTSTGLAPGLHTVANTADAKSATTEPVHGKAEVKVLVPFLSIAKRALLSDVQAGDVVPFEIVVTNQSAGDDAVSLAIHDTLPAGLVYRPGTTRVDGLPAPDPAAQGRLRTWQVARLAGGKSLRISFHCVVSAASRPDTVVNVADVTASAPTGQPLAAGPARAAVRIQPGFFSERSLVIGRVFVDTTGDGMPDDGKPGLANVAVFTETGMMAITDEEGKYVLPDIAPGDHVVRLDVFTLPAGYTLTATDNSNAGTPKSRFCRVPRGGMAKANFAAKGSGPRVGSARPGTPAIRQYDPSQGQPEEPGALPPPAGTGQQAAR